VRCQILVDAGDGTVVLANGAAYPVDVSNGTILSASPPDNLKNAIETAGDLTQVQRTFIITGTEFGVKLDPMPLNINITNTGYNCSAGKLYGSTLRNFLLTYLLTLPFVKLFSRIFLSEVDVLLHYKQSKSKSYVGSHSVNFFVLFVADNTMHTCCLEPNSNITLTGDNIFLPSETGNITITYDVSQAYTTNYQALVSDDETFHEILKY
jgi:hypothetical protein